MLGLWNWRGSAGGARGVFPTTLDASGLSAWIRAQRNNMPKTRIGRTMLGMALVLGGVFSFLPLLGIWMLPLGAVVLSIDWPFVRRKRRQAEVNLSRWWRSRQAAGAT